MFPSIKFLTGTYISQRNSICWNDRRNSNTSCVCGDCQRRCSAPFPWKLTIPVLAVLSSMLLGGVAKSFWNCGSGVSAVENWLFASWTTTSRYKSSRPEAWSCGSLWPQLTEPKDRVNVPAEKISEMSAGVQPSTLWEPLLPLMKYVCFKTCSQKLLLFFSISWLQCPLLLPLCRLTQVLSGKSNCKSRMNSWRKDEELLELCTLTSRFPDLLCGVPWCSVAVKKCIITGCLFRMPSSLCSIWCSCGSELAKLWCVFAVFVLFCGWLLLFSLWWCWGLLLVCCLFVVVVFY